MSTRDQTRDPVEGRSSRTKNHMAGAELAEGFTFEPITGLPGRMGRTGVITTPHGLIRTPAFIAVGTKATVKAVLPETMAELGAQALLANAYHLYLQPGADIVDAAGAAPVSISDGVLRTSTAGAVAVALLRA